MEGEGRELEEGWEGEGEALRGDRWGGEVGREAEASRKVAEERWTAEEKRVRASGAEGGANGQEEDGGQAVPGERSLLWLADRERGRLCRKRFILLKPRGSSASDMVSSDSAEA